MLPCMKKKEGEKGGRWVPRRKRRGEVVRPTCHGGMRAAAIGEGVLARVRCGSGGGVSARAVVGHRTRASESRERWGTGG
jgi:hypothetical protein